MSTPPGLRWAIATCESCPNFLPGFDIEIGGGPFGQGCKLHQIKVKAGYVCDSHPALKKERAK